MSLTVWGNNLLSTGKWYKITNASVRTFQQRTCLSTRVDTTFTIIDNHPPDEATVIDDTDTKRGTILVADVKTNYRCPLGHPLTSVNFDTTMTRCKTCVAYCRTKNVEIALEAILRVKFESTVNKVVLEDSVIRKLLNIDAETKVDPDDVVALLLEKEDMQLTFTGQHVLSAAFVQDLDQKTKVDTEPSNTNESIVDFMDKKQR